MFVFGDAIFAGDTSGLHLNGIMVGMAPDPVTGGYWLIGSDGGVFAFGAPFFGSTGSIHLNQPVVAMQSTSDGGRLLVRRFRRRHLRLRRRALPGLHGRAIAQQPMVGMFGFCSAGLGRPQASPSPRVTAHVPTA